MRYTPVAVALSLLVAVSSSVTYSEPQRVLDPRAVTLLGQGRAAVASGNYNAAIDAYESALTVEPGSVAVLLGLADATRREGLQGKALHYYHVALTADPRNLEALAGEGVALAEKGATDKANRNLARLESLCGQNCTETKTLSMAIAKEASQPRVVTAEASAPKSIASEN